MGESQLHYRDSHFIPKAKLFEGHAHTLFPSDVHCPLCPHRARPYQGRAGRANENSRYCPFVNPVSCVLEQAGRQRRSH